MENTNYNLDIKRADLSFELKAAEGIINNPIVTVEERNKALDYLGKAIQEFDQAIDIKYQS